MAGHLPDLVHTLYRGRHRSGIGPPPPKGIFARKECVRRPFAMSDFISDMTMPDQLVLVIQNHVVPVAAMRLAKPLGPARFEILLGTIGGLASQVPGYLAAFDSRFLIPTTAVVRHHRG